ncbi:K+-transporting ATPase ATPase B chain [Arthrobacter stackebrandtii]|uniref:Potassium-transporting ATPase ATP-binding subunit n=1 Tax=Arthrobacter stackebrandtii TaxID=272161 RepID=A0ABS4YWR3_9MICC|nr:potassium-transporting ATPase subunit KdpB [Arthrobacter stackebrandtii]MBP2413222.1 K+-transporting ATPase ATPase B chain [Arthrobacter stackebrandtii]PYH01030.1 K(+)-transporting ATPase subunit B [Arthrobacter stackebrandtii]
MNPTNTLAALPLAFRKLNPRQMVHSPVMFTVLIGSMVCTAVSIQQLATGSTTAVFSIIVTVWLWLTVLFGNLSEAIAEGRGKAQADSLRAARTSVMARRRTRALMPAGGSGAGRDGDAEAGHDEELVPGTDLKVGDIVICEAGDLIPGDGDVIEGLASVDESAITGESAPVIRESGGDRSSVTGGTMVLSDRIVIRITAASGKTFLDRMISLVEGATRQKTPNEIALNVLLASLTIVFVVCAMTLAPMANFANALPTPVVLVALLVCLIPTTIGALVPAIGISGMDRLIQRNVLATSGRAVETAGDITTLLLDKTGTITYGNRRAVAFLAADGVDRQLLIDSARLSSLADETPEGRSIVDLAVELAGGAGEVPGLDATATLTPEVEVIEFSAVTRMSGLNLPAGHPANPTPAVLEVRKGAASAVERYVKERGGFLPQKLQEAVLKISGTGGTPLLVSTYGGGRAQVLGVIHLADVVKPGMKERFAELRAMGIKTIMITGDNKITAAAIAAEAGVDDFVAEATPEDKLAVIKAEQEAGRLVAMTGDGTNDAPALAAADVGVAMNSGTSAAKEAANMVDLDSDPTKLIDIVGIGKQLLITRGSLTTFSVANDVAKYFAIVPALFAATFPGLGLLNIMGLASPESAILSAVIFNAVIIVLLVPLALRGVKYRAVSAAKALSRNLLIFGLGGVIAPFIGIKLIDLLVSLIPTIGN